MKRSWVRGKGVEKGPEKRKSGETIGKNVEIYDIFAILEFSMDCARYLRVEWRKKEIMKDFRDLGF